MREEQKEEEEDEHGVAFSQHKANDDNDGDGAEQQILYHICKVIIIL